MPLFTAKCNDSVRMVGKPETIQKRTSRRSMAISPKPTNEMVRRLISLHGQGDRRGSFLKGGSSTWRYIQLASIWARRPFT